MGMEYQTHLHGRDRLACPRRLAPDRPPDPEMVVVHEFGHGYWYGLVASNEFEESWMDEGINSFTEYEMMDRRYGGIADPPLRRRIGSSDLGRLQTITARETDRLVTPSWRFATGTPTAGTPTPAAGDGRRPDPAPRRRGERSGGRSGPRPSAGASTTRRPRTSSTPSAPPPDGGSSRSSGRPGTGTERSTTPSPDSRAREVQPVRGVRRQGEDGSTRRRKRREAEEGSKANEDASSRSSLVGRTGTIPLPVEVVLTFENGATWKTTWDGAERWLRLRTTYRSRLAKAEVDPGPEGRPRREPLEQRPLRRRRNRALRRREGPGLRPPRRPDPPLLPLASSLTERTP